MLLTIYFAKSSDFIRSSMKTRLFTLAVRTDARA